MMKLVPVFGMCMKRTRDRAEFGRPAKARAELLYEAQKGALRCCSGLQEEHMPYTRMQPNMAMQNLESLVKQSALSRQRPLFDSPITYAKKSSGRKIYTFFYQYMIISAPDGPLIA